MCLLSKHKASKHVTCSTPTSRRSLLDDVRKHSDSLLHPALASKAVQADGESDGGSKYWKELVDTFFVKGPAKRSRAQDDILFFVRKHVSAKGSL